MPTLDKSRLQSVSDSFKGSTGSAGLLSGISNIFQPDQSSEMDPKSGALSVALQAKRNKLANSKGMADSNVDDDEKMTKIK